MVETAGNYRFTKAERLCSKKRIESLFHQGRSRWKGCLRITYLISDEALEAPVQVMFAVPKKQFSRAIDRNVLKRRMREAYRLNKQDLIKQVSSLNKYILIVFLYIGKQVETYSLIEAELKELLANVSKSFRR